MMISRNRREGCSCSAWSARVGEQLPALVPLGHPRHVGLDDEGIDG